MKYQNIRTGTFLERPNRFIAKVKIDGQTETVHVKNTGRLAELFVPGALVYVQEMPDAPDRKTRWDLIAVKKGDRLFNVDSQAPNQVAKEWLKEGNFIPDLTRICPEYTWGDSRFDFYLETADGRKIFLEVKGVTLEDGGAFLFPDAPSDRAVKHIRELARALKAGYETYILFVIQTDAASYFTPNAKAQPAFAQALSEAADAGVGVLACDCQVRPDMLQIKEKIPVVLGDPLLCEIQEPLLAWYSENRRDLPWRKNPDAYRVWVSEIMLQQTRVEAVKPYYERFLKELPDVRHLAEVSEDKLLKLWEGLGYYNRARNMQKAARQMVEQYGGEFPRTYEEIRGLCGIGDYTAGAIASIAFGLPEPAVDGNVLRVVARLTENDADVLKQHTKEQIEEELRRVIPVKRPGDFNQGLIELGALICLPGGDPKCGQCPLKNLCLARMHGRVGELPVRTKQKKRRVEEKTVLYLRDGEKVALRKRGPKGLLAGMYELPNLNGHLTRREVTAYLKSIGLMPVRIKRLPQAKHVFTHVEWHMIGYEVLVDELEKTNEKRFLFIRPDEIRQKYPVPSAFAAYLPRSGRGDS